MNRCNTLTRRVRVGTIRLILSDFVGQHQRRSERHGRTHPGGRGLQTDRSQGPRRRSRPGVDPRDHGRLQHPGSVERGERAACRHVGCQRAGRLGWRERRHAARSRSVRTIRTRTPTRRPCRPSSMRSRPRPASRSRSTPSTTTLSRTRSARTSRARRTTRSPGSPAIGCGSSPIRVWPPTSPTCGPRSAPTSATPSRRRPPAMTASSTSSRSTTTRGS